ncbi:MAG: sulfite exporter TauE/SafE family protein [Elusimicrobiota bacterium]
MEIRELLKFFVAGFSLANGPCLLICLPVILPYIVAKGSDWKSGLRLAVVFSLSRVIAYSVLGLIAALAYRSAMKLVGPQQFWTKTLLGIIVLLIGIAYLLGKDLNPFCKYLHRWTVEKSSLSIITMGLLIGFSPCMPLLGILTYIAATSENTFTGFLSGLSFGLGTIFSPVIPLGIFSGIVSRWSYLSGQPGKRPVLFIVLRIVSGLILVYFGVQLLRGLANPS